MPLDTARLSGQIRVRRREGVLEQRSGETTVLLSIANGQYYALDEVGSDIWTLLAAGSTVEAVVRGMAERYDAPFEVLLRDVSDLLAELADEELVEIGAPE